MGLGLGLTKQTVLKFIVSRQLVKRARERAAEGGGDGMEVEGEGKGEEEEEEEEQEETHVSNPREYFMVLEQLLGEGSEWDTSHVKTVVDKVKLHFVDNGEIERPRVLPQFVKVNQQKSKGCVIITGRDNALVTEDSCACPACLAMMSPLTMPLQSAGGPDLVKVVGCEKGTVFQRVKLDKISAAGVVERRKEEGRRGARLALDAAPWMLATVEGNIGDYNRAQGGTAAEYGYDVVLLRDPGHRRGHEFFGTPVVHKYVQRGRVSGGGGWDDVSFWSGHHSLQVEYFLRDQTDPSGMTFYRSDDGVDWGSVINSAKLRMTGLELLDGAEQVKGRIGSSGKYLKDRYLRGHRYVIPDQFHHETLNACLDWTPNPGGELEEDGEDGEGDMVEDDDAEEMDM